MIRSYAVAIASLLAGASVVHSIYKPDLTIPGVDSGRDREERETGEEGGEERGQGSAKESTQTPVQQEKRESTA
ncbi:hypothetical protein CLOP_g21996 [Closterium sp. NIES-67]|nr:hypothetical protein CLOP_g21996 [Closterium sp. NIES-67]